MDAISDDGRHGLSIIAFVGSVFSPWYAWAGRRSPENHCAVNVALYGPGASLWSMTERGSGAMDRDLSSLRIGDSAMQWDGTDLIIEIDEITAPSPPVPSLPRRLRGRIRVSPEGLNGHSFSLDEAGRHGWRPIAPRARVEVAFEKPGLSWSGDGYFDCNAGTEPMEAAFETWTWSRTHLKRGSAILYDVARRDGSWRNLSLKVDAGGAVHVAEAPPVVALPGTIWGIARPTRCEAAARARIIRTWEDTPFYARSTVSTRLHGEEVESVHESLSLARLRSPFVRTLLAFRMPRSLR